MSNQRNQSQNNFIEVEVKKGIFLAPEDIGKVDEIIYNWEYRERGPNNKFVTYPKESKVKKNSSGGFSFTYDEGPQKGNMVVLIESPKAKRKAKAMIDGEMVIERKDYSRRAIKVAKGVTIPIDREIAKKFRESRAVEAVI